MPAGVWGAGVREQVRDDLMHASGVSHDRHGFVGHVDVPVVVGRGRPRVRETLEGQLGQVDRAVDQLPALIETGQQQQVLDEPGHPQRLGLDALQRRRRASR